MKTFTGEEVAKYSNLLVKDPFHRYLSWDHCFNAFSEKSQNEEQLSLSLAFYLASWGMYRGSAGILQKNHRIHIKAVEIILSDKYDPIRCSQYEVNSSHIALIIDLKNVLGA